MTAAFSPPFPTNPSPGDTFCGWTWNGSMWVCTSGQAVFTTTFLVSGPYTPQAGLIGLTVETVGGGGAGGGAVISNAQYALGGGGGGAGAYSRKSLAAALVRGGVLVTVGLGGTDAMGQPGGAGGETAFGVLCTANGGQGGNVNNAPVGWGAPGAGGYGGVGDLFSGGAPGTVGFTDLSGLGANQVIFGGAGGSGPWGGGGQAVYAGGGSFAAGQAGLGPGAGGSGGISNMVLGQATGGPGYAGVCVVTEYCFADQGGSWSGCGGGGQARVAIGSTGWQQGWDGND